MRGDILGVERQRRWGDDEKLGIVLSVGVNGATVTQVAQRYDVTRQQIYAWRHELKKKRLLSALPEALYLPVELDRQAELAVPAPMALQVRHDLRLRRLAHINDGLALEERCRDQLSAGHH